MYRDALYNTCIRGILREVPKFCFDARPAKCDLTNLVGKERERASAGTRAADWEPGNNFGAHNIERQLRDPYM